MENRISKVEARAWGKEQRKLIDADALDGWRSFQNEILFHSIDLQKVQVVHVFLPMLNKVEPDLWPLLARWKVQYPQLIFAAPVSDFETHSFEQYELDINHRPPHSIKGIPEPLKTRLIPPENTDLAFVPLLAADVYGNRVGYGAGFYDRFLARCADTCVKIGVALYPCIETEIEHDAHDIKLDYYASLTEIVKTRL